MRTQSIRNERGAALLETAITIPIILVISVGIFEFGRAYQTSQVLTNAAREGARVAIIAGTTKDDVETVVKNYITGGAIELVEGTTIDVENDSSFASNGATRVTISYPFNFIVLNPVVRLISPSSKVGEPLTLRAVALMRNEG